MVELLVVIGIIALLIGILLPSLIKARTSAYNVMCCANLRQIGIAFTAYAADNKGMAPAPQLSIPLYSVVGTPLQPGVFYWQEALWQYLVPKRPLPSDAYSATSTHSWLNGTVFACPRGVLNTDMSQQSMRNGVLTPVNDYLTTGYSMNQNLPGVPVIEPGGVAGPHYNEYKLIRRVRCGSATILVADGDTGWVGATTAGSRYPQSVTGASGLTDFDIVAGPTVDGCQNRHPKGFVNVLMVDGSAGPRQWMYSMTDIPIPPLIDPTNPLKNPSLFAPNVQAFWYGHTPDNNGW